MGAYWSRINTVLLLMVLLGIIGLFATRAIGGPLDPPGAPGSTDGVREPGTPIASIPFNITQPGYYYLTRNLVATSPLATGIFIQSDEVTLDLKGFSLQGYVENGTGILVEPVQTWNVVIRNGAISHWNVGIQAGNLEHGRIEDISVVYGASGIITSGGIVQDCMIHHTTANGATLTKAILRNCTIAANSGNGVTATEGSLIEENLFINNGGSAGTYASILLSGTGQNIVRDNHNSGAKTDPFVRMTSSYNLVIRNRYRCTGGVVDTGVANYVAGSGGSVVEDTNYCFAN